MTHQKDIVWSNPIETQGGLEPVVFGGDFYLSRASRATVWQDVLDEQVAREIRASSFAIANLEGSITSSMEKSPKGFGPHLALNEGSAAILRQTGFRAVTLANNHTMDFGRKGLADTIEACRQSEVLTVGAGANAHDAAQPLSITLPNARRLTVLAFCEREMGIADSCHPGTAWLVGPGAERCIQEAKRTSDVVIVCAHGGNERVPLPSLQRRTQLRQLVEAGADLVIGHHPHVPQGWEHWGGGHIFYSLGNFYFDSLTGERSPWQDWSFLLRAWIGTAGVQALQIIPFFRRGDRLALLDSARDIYLDYLKRLSGMTVSADFPAYWQVLAVTLLLDSYVPDGRALFQWDSIFPRGLAGRLASAARLIAGARSARDDGHRPEPGDVLVSRQRALALLNTMRCESHRWTFETALSLLTGESEDLRTEKTRREMDAVRRAAKSVPPLG
jgi:poly-gamma-glutamate synthesis protein (capsule biosynthesis protein)